MAAPTIQQIREGIATNLASIDDVQASAYQLGNATPPMFEVQLGWKHDGLRSIDYDKTFRRGLDALNFTVRAMVGLVSDIGAQQRLDRFISPSGSESVKAAVETDQTLGGKVHDLRVSEFAGPFSYRREGGAPLWGGEWHVEVWATGA